MSAASEYLTEADPVLAGIVPVTPEPPPSVRSDPFTALVESIVHQQLSVKVAAAIWSRFRALFPKNEPKADLLLALSEEELRSAGLSRQKAKYVHAVARFALEGGLDQDYLDSLSNEEAIRHLTAIYGVGRWTVEMLLMSALGREDVFAPDDLTIQQAMQKLYHLDDLKGKTLTGRMTEIAQQWSPHRTLACRYLWAWKHATDAKVSKA